MRQTSSLCFFFQAEDGIRDLVRSRGLGDVYKRQGAVGVGHFDADDLHLRHLLGPQNAHLPQARRLGPVSYTHLTLPTSDLV